MPAEYSSLGGVVRNPHDIRYGRGTGIQRRLGGGGAAGFAPIAIGGETQNSIQTPASFRRGRIETQRWNDQPRRDHAARAEPGCTGVLARSVDDAAIVFAAIGGADAHDPSRS
jgi:amidase